MAGKGRKKEDVRSVGSDAVAHTVTRRGDNSRPAKQRFSRSEAHITIRALHIAAHIRRRQDDEPADQKQSDEHSRWRKGHCQVGPAQWRCAALGSRESENVAASEVESGLWYLGMFSFACQISGRAAPSARACLGLRIAT